eukprot:Colp12_sorted_trinity150504_noHs@18388
MMNRMGGQHQQKLSIRRCFRVVFVGQHTSVAQQLVGKRMGMFLLNMAFGYSFPLIFSKAPLYTEKFFVVATLPLFTVRVFRLGGTGCVTCTASAFFTSFAGLFVVAMRFRLRQGYGSNSSSSSGCRSSLLMVCLQL